MVSTQINPLKTNFYGRGEVRGFLFSQMEASDKAYLYRVTTPQNDIHFEVFMHKVNKSPALKSPQVSYPTSKAFGAWAWTYSDLESAYKKYAELCK